MTIITQRAYIDSKGTEIKMAETSTASPSAPEIRRPSVEEKIWAGVDSGVAEVLSEAGRFIDSHGLDNTSQNLARVAFAMQNKRLEGVDHDEMTTSELTTQQLSLLVLEAPFAARAHESLALHKAGEISLNNAQRAQFVAIASRFNHHFAETLSCMPASMTNNFHERVRAHMENLFQKKLDLPSVTKESMQNVAAGMRREVAVSRALRATLPEDWSVRHATAEEDAIGIDVIIADDQGYEYNMDIKSGNAFLNRVQSLTNKGRLTLEQQAEAIERGYVVVGTGRRADNIETCIFDADRFGNIVSYEYPEPEKVAKFVYARMYESDF